jgi:hypothetical protein
MLDEHFEFWLALIPVVGNTTLLNPIVSGAYSGSRRCAFFPQIDILV